jgi:iron complex transport system permease protein
MPLPELQPHISYTIKARLSNINALLLPLMYKALFFFLFLFLLTLLLVWSGLFVGSFRVEVATLTELLVGGYSEDNPVHIAVVQLRLPRILLAFVTGSSLALCGYLMQAMINNPLADPYILGTASGAALGANLAYLGILPVMAMGLYLPPFWAFGGAMGVTLLVAFLASRKGVILPSQLLLAGIAMSSLIGSCISLLTFLSDSDNKLRNIVFWLLGSFERAQWSHLPLPAMALIIAVPLFSLMYKQLNILLLGEHRALHLGLHVGRLRLIILAAASFITALVVAVAGPIGFVGLLIPHLVRGVFGVSGRYNILFAAWVGGLYTLGCDLAARLLYPPAGIPVGIITSFLGIPFFVYLLWKKSFKFA